jgi:hypothetical protein
MDMPRLHQMLEELNQLTALESERLDALDEPRNCNELIERMRQFQSALEQFCLRWGIPIYK